MVALQYRDEWGSRTGSVGTRWSQHWLGMRVLGIFQGVEKGVVERGTFFVLC